MIFDKKLMDCTLCIGNFSSNQILFEGIHCIVIYPLEPAVYGHIMIVPKRHVPFFAEMNEEEMLEVKSLMQQIHIKFKEEKHSVGYNLLSNNGGEGVGQHVLHTHLHMFVRFKNDINPFKVLSKSIEKKIFTPEEWAINRIQISEIIVK